MPKYTPSFVDVSRFSKALTAQLNRNAQLNLRREQVVDNSINQYLRTYTGKVRQVDLPKFLEKFDNYRNAAKGYMNFNRSGVAGAELPASSMTKEAAYQDMAQFAEKSIQYGGVQSSLGKMQKSVRNRDKFYSVYGDLSSLTADQLDEKYKGIENIPRDFGFDEKAFDKSKFGRNIALYLPAASSVPNKWVPVKNDDGTDKFEEVTYTIKGKNNKDINVNYKVPVSKFNFSVDPMSIRLAVIEASRADTKAEDFLDVYKDLTLASSKDQKDPQLASQYKEIVDNAMKLYGKTDENELTGADLYAATLARKSDFGEITKLDYDRLGDIMAIAKAQTGFEMDDLRKKALLQQMNQSKENNKDRALVSALNLLKTSKGLGLIGIPGTGDYILNSINSAVPGLNLNKDTFLQAAQAEDEETRQFYRMLFNNR